MKYCDPRSAGMRNVPCQRLARLPRHPGLRWYRTSRPRRGGRALVRGVNSCTNEDTEDLDPALRIRISGSCHRPFRRRPASCVTWSLFRRRWDRAQGVVCGPESKPRFPSGHRDFRFQRHRMETVRQGFRRLLRGCSRRQEFRSIGLLRRCDRRIPEWMTTRVRSRKSRRSVSDPIDGR